MVNGSLYGDFYDRLADGFSTHRGVLRLFKDGVGHFPQGLFCRRQERLPLPQGWQLAGSVAGSGS